jgi:Flp pilus assembly pilin Flp
MKGGLARTDLISRLCLQDEAADATEYALMLSLIAVAIIGAVASFGGALADGFNHLTGRMPAITSN